jgi:putative hydrolase of the HAD superfamily
MPRAVLLDLFDTIVSSDWASWTRRTADLIGVDTTTVDQAYARTRRSRNTGAYPDVETETHAVLEAIGIQDPPIDLVRSVASAQFEFMRDQIELEPDVAPTVAELRGHGALTALISNCSHHAVALIDRLELASLFDALILSFQVGAAKPDAAIYELALEQLGGIPPTDAVFVDDQVTFCDGARALGIDTRLLLRPHAAPPEGVSPEANGHVVIEDLTPLLDG